MAEKIDVGIKEFFKGRDVFITGGSGKAKMWNVQNSKKNIIRNSIFIPKKNN